METLLIALPIILIGAKIGSHFAKKLGQPEVLGELIVGVILGNLGLIGIYQAEVFKHDAAIHILSEVGVILLLFHVGLETSIQEMSRTGFSSFLVASLGVIAPFILGFGVAHSFLPEHSIYVHLFIATTLCATSVGITARVLSDLNQTQSKEGKIILGAAVIDDVLGLIVLAIVMAMVTSASSGQTMDWSEIVKIVFKAILFLVGAIVVGVTGSKSLLKFISKINVKGLLLISALSICFFYSYLATMVGLASIVGAFAAGLVLEESHFKNFKETKSGSLNDLLNPILDFLVPIFFVQMGMNVELQSLFSSESFGLAMALTFVAILGKQVCGLGVLEKGIKKTVVGLGMIPRGEVGLIVANIGLTMKLGKENLIDPATFSAIIMVVAVTTLITPPLLKWGFRRS